MHTCIWVKVCWSSPGTAHVPYSVCGSIILYNVNITFSVKGHIKRYIEHIELYAGMNI